MAYSLSSKLPFGKHKGLTVAAVLRFDPGYFSWARRTIDGFALDDAAMAAFKTANTREWNAKMERQNGWAWGFGAAAKHNAERDRFRKIQIEHEERRKAGLPIGEPANA